MRAVLSHPRLVLCVLATAGLVLATGGTASAEPPVVGRGSSTVSESFTDTLSECSDELYDISVNGKGRFHYTYFEDTGALFFHERGHATIVGIPHDGTGPTYRGYFRDSDQESIRAVSHGSVLVEQDTDIHSGVMHGSDGSRLSYKGHAHFTLNANGELTVHFDTFRFTCP